MKIKYLLPIVFCLIFFNSCEKERALEKYYNQEGNFSGSIYNALDTSGVFNYLVQGIDSAEFTNQLKNTLVTVIAPSDKAFKAYLDKKGYSGLSDMPKSEMEDLIGHHIITWPHSPTSFGIDPFYFKRRTNMAQRTTFKYDQILGADVEVVKESKYLQFYSKDVLEHYGGSVDDYNLLTGNNLSAKTGYNINNIPVDSIVPYGNGWIYYVDEVIEPVQNLDDWLLNSEDHSLFNSLFNRYSIYYTDNDVSSAAPVKRNNVFQNNRYYRIDMELCFETVGFIKKGNSLLSLKGASGFTVVAPKNDVLNEFIDTYFKDYPGFRDSLAIVNKTSMGNLHINKIIRSIIQPYLFIDKQVFPSNLSSAAGVFGFDGTNFKYTDADITEYNLCSNGFGYGVNKFIVPRSFKSILKPAFTTPTYTYFAAAVSATKIAGFLNNDSADYTLMIPSDSAFIKNHIYLMDVETYNSDYGGTFSTTDGLNETVFLRILPGQDAEHLDVQALFDLVFSHLFTENILLSSQKQFAKSAIGSYIGLTSDSIWSGGNLVSVGAKVPKVIENITDVDNGQVYVVDDLIKAPESSLGAMIRNNPEYSSFKSLCESSGLLSGSNLDVFGNYPTVFIPTNAALDSFAKVQGNIPTEDAELKTFVKYFFVDNTIFSTETLNESIATLSKDEEKSTDFINIYRMVDVSGSPGNLKVKGENNNAEIEVIEGNKSNIICTNGIIHLVDGVLN